MNTDLIQRLNSSGEIDKVISISKKLLKKFNFSDDESPYRFEKFDGFRSQYFDGYTFGLVQYDLSTNWQAVQCLKRCKLKPGEVFNLFDPTEEELERLNKKIAFYKHNINSFDSKYIELATKRLIRLITENDIFIKDEQTFLMLLDYHHIFFINTNGRLVSWMREIGSNITPEMLVDFITFNTKWGMHNSDEVKERAAYILDRLQE